ncbi:MAG: hypothetical protein J7L46_02325, partial [Bacteroidales bacterium]|nr:hypothetical protein [Bacteroidales bacterium]
MKKLFLAVVAIGFIASVSSSCKKDYTCECTVSGTAVNLEYTKMKKADAEDACSQAETTYKISDASA